MNKPELSFEEYKQLAELSYNPGFRLLLDCIKANLDNLSQELQECSSDKESNILGRWRGFREIYTILSSTPELMASHVREMEESEENKMPNRIFGSSANMTSDKIEKLKRDYERITGKKVILV